MEQQTTNPSKSRNKIALFSGIVVAIIAIVYFSFYYPPTSKEDVLGTIGKAAKYRADQMTDKDVALKNPEIQKFLQSDKLQKILNNEESHNRTKKTPAFPVFKNIS